MSDTKTAPRTVIVYGPAISGHTFHVHAIKAAFGCRGVTEYLDMRQPLKLNQGGLHETCWPAGDWMLAVPRDVLILLVSTALAIAYMKGLI